MKVIALVTLVVGNKEYLPQTAVDIQNEKEAKSLISRGFASTFKKKEVVPEKPDNKKDDGKLAESQKNDDDDNLTQENENDGATVQKSGGQPI